MFTFNQKGFIGSLIGGIIFFIIAAGTIMYLLNQEAVEVVTETKTESETITGQIGIADLKVGEGSVAENGDVLTVHYVGTFEDGSVFDSSLERGAPFDFQLGARQVILGWDLGLLGMKVGGKRRLEIPPEIAYGEAGRPGIPPNSTLIFEVELLAIQGK